jgi:hypothetical protein
MTHNYRERRQKQLWHNLSQQRSTIFYGMEVYPKVKLSMVVESCQSAIPAHETAMVSRIARRMAPSEFIGNIPHFFTVGIIPCEKRRRSLIRKFAYQTSTIYTLLAHKNLLTHMTQNTFESWTSYLVSRISSAIVDPLPCASSTQQRAPKILRHISLVVSFFVNDQDLKSAFATTTLQHTSILKKDKSRRQQWLIQAR